MCLPNGSKYRRTQSWSGLHVVVNVARSVARDYRASELHRKRPRLQCSRSPLSSPRVLFFKLLIWPLTGSVGCYNTFMLSVGRFTHSAPDGSLPPAKWPIDLDNNNNKNKKKQEGKLLSLTMIG